MKKEEYPYSILERQKVIHSLRKCCELGDDAAIRSILETTDLEDVCDTIVKDVQQYGVADPYDLLNIVSVLTYLEEELGIPSPVSDTVYDNALECLNDFNMDTSIGFNTALDADKTVREHKYPELRGSLQKVHFPLESDIPEKDSRRSLDQFLKNTLGIFLEENPDEIVRILTDFKWDGTSNVFECARNDIIHVLTRYKVKENLGKDVSHVYNGLGVKDVFGNRIPSQVYDMKQYGIKTEIIMRENMFEGYKRYIKDDRCNRRSAVSSILNHSEDNFSQEMLAFIEAIPLQISTKEPIPGNPNIIQVEDFAWYYVGKVNGRHQYISNYMKDRPLGISSFVMTRESMSEYYGVDSCRGLAENLYNDNMLWVTNSAKNANAPIDGMVFTLFNEKIVEKLGRSGDKNNFQVAFKFPAGEKTTIIKDVEFQVGPIAGSITPVAVVSPIIINGSRISHVGLSNLDKLKRLDLSEGDEVVIQYDIIPKLKYVKERHGGKKIVPPTSCPICGEKIKEGKCSNPDCDAKLIGRISNYVSKMNIPGFGIETITTLVSRGILESISDLYKLSQAKKEMMSIPGFQTKTVDKLVSAPLSRTRVYPHELFGSVGIPSISLGTMEKVCRVYQADTLLADPNIIRENYKQIKGVGKINAAKIVEGIRAKEYLIKQLLPYFKFKEYADLVGNVVFTGVRDPEFSEYLRDIHHIGTTTSVSSKTLAVIKPDGEENLITGSIKAAKEKDVPIYTLTEAKSRWGYNLYS